MQDQICIITPCFNPGRFLLPCLESVSAQSEYVKKHIVIDGGSTDGTVPLLAKYETMHPKLVWRSERDGGQSHALNKALALVDTQFFGWLNADDCYIPEMIGPLIRAAKSTDPSSVSIAYGDYKVIDAEGNILWSRRQPSFNFLDCLYSYLTVQNGAAIFNADLFRKVGCFDESLKFCMDYDAILKLGKIGRVTHVREYIGLFRHHEAAKTATLQDVCSKETKALRLRYSNCSEQSLKLRHGISKARVAIRMARERCLWSRFGLEV
jgi:glycosyltransferase involved in cell wall biosynthesis